MLIEAKYSLPRGGEALARLGRQAANGLQSGKAQDFVVWTLKQASTSQVKVVLDELGEYATRVQFVEGVEGLYRFLEFYFRTRK